MTTLRTHNRRAFRVHRLRAIKARLLRAYLEAMPSFYGRPFSPGMLEELDLAARAAWARTDR